MNELEKLKPYVLENISLANIVRGSDEDFKLVFGVNNAHEAFEILLEKGCGNLIYTANRNDILMISKSNTLTASVPEIEPISTIGAGDSFNAGLVWTLVRNKLSIADMDNLPEKIMMQVMANGTSFAAEVCMSYDNYISEEFAFRLK